MPYLPSDARKKSEEYNNILSGDVIEYQNTIEDLKKSLNISGSVVDAKAPLRNSEGILQSFEGSIDGLSLEEDFQQVRLENKQFFFTGQIDNQFTYYFQPLAEDTTDTTTTTNTKEVEFALTLRDYLIQFVNEFYGEENGPDISTDLLHNKLLQFFDENRSKGNNAQGWEEFRLNESRKAAGISGKRFGKVKKDLRDFQYDELIENHLYRTPQGQRIWLRLGFPYIVDQSPGKDS